MKPLYWLLVAAVVVYFVLLKPKGKTTAAGGRMQPSGVSPVGEAVGKIVDGAVSLFKTSPAVGGVSPGQSPSTEFSIEELESSGLGGI